MTEAFATTVGTAIPVLALTAVVQAQVMRDNAKKATDEAANRGDNILSGCLVGFLLSINLLIARALITYWVVILALGSVAEFACLVSLTTAPNHWWQSTAVSVIVLIITMVQLLGITLAPGVYYLLEVRQLKLPTRAAPAPKFEPVDQGSDGRAQKSDSEPHQDPDNTE